MTDAIPADAAERVQIVILDVDGVLTDGGVYIGATRDGQPLEMKRFDTNDQLGVKMLIRAGIEVVMASGRVSAANHLRAEELGVACVEGPGGNKLEVVDELLTQRSLGWQQAACVCDDLADLPIIARAGLPVAVANAVAEVRARATWVTRRPGGSGAVREFSEALLRARGQWNSGVDAYVRERGGVP